MAPNILVTPADYEFWGFLSDKFPLGTAQSTMCLLHQRTISKGLVVESDIRARVYYNLVVFFRLLWHHRTLEPAPKFWKYIWQDFPAQAAKTQDLENLMAFYVSARAAFRRRYQDSKGPGSFLAKLVDQWRSRPLISGDTAPYLSSTQIGHVYFKLRQSWDAARRGGYSELTQSKELNWPVFGVPSQNKPKRVTTRSKSKSSSYQSSAGKDEPKRSSDPAKASTATDPKQEDRLSLPPCPWKKKDRTSSIKISFPTGGFNSEPGRLTPPIELQSLRRQEKASSTGAPPPAERKNASDNSTIEVESSMPDTPPKRPAPESDELSPFSKRRCMSQMDSMLATSSEHPAPQPGETSPFSRRRCVSQMTVGQSDSIGEWCSIFAQASIPEQQNGGAKVPLSSGFNLPKPSVEAQSLEEMIASAVGSPPPGNGSRNVLPSSPGIADNFRLPERNAPAGAARDGVVPPPFAPIQGSSLVVIDMPATLFAFSRKVESLEKMVKEQAGVRGFITALSHDVATLSKTIREQAEIHDIASMLSRRVADIEDMVQGRADVSATVASSVSALTWTMGCLEKKLGEATDTQNTIADLSYRIAELEKTAERGDVIEANRMTGLKTTVDALPKMIEEGEFQKAGEVVEYRENQREDGSSTP